MISSERTILLTEQARQEHQARFQPLQDILTHLVKPVRAIRDQYFPGSPIFVVDHYERHYWQNPRYYDNLYYRALMILDRATLSEPVPELLAVYAMAEEPARRKLILFGPYQDTRYTVGIGLHWKARDWGRFLQLATGVSEDLASVTPETDLFEIVQNSEGGRIVFASYHGTVPSLQDIRPVIDEPIRFRQNPETFAAIDARLTSVLSFKFPSSRKLTGPLLPD